MESDGNVLDWKESAEERSEGTIRVTITGIRQAADTDFLAEMIARQREIGIIEAKSELRSIAFGQPLECFFKNASNAHLFSMACEMKGALCNVDE